MIIAARGTVASTVSGLAYRWVAVGNSGDLRTCDDTSGTTWTSRTSSFGATGINKVESNGSSLYVAVGQSGKLATSPDGINWTQQTSSFGTSSIWSVAYGTDGYWVAVGDGNKVATSTDGVTWTQQSTGVTNPITVAFGNGLWAIGATASGNISTASNPTSTWTLRTSTLAGWVGWIHYAKGLGIWVAGRDSGTTGALASSTDGITWTARTSTISAAAFPITGQYFQTTTSNATVIAGGSITNTGSSPNTIDFESSTNGTTWTNRTPADNTDNLRCAASDDLGNMMMGGTSAQVSSDGITWTLGGGMGDAFGLCHSSGVPAIR